MYFRLSMVIVTILILTLIALAEPPDKTAGIHLSSATASVDNTTFIDANKILMFITNHGNFGRDLARVFGYDCGTFYPYIGTEYIEADVLTTSPLYAAGIWFGGLVSGEIRVVVSEYSSEFVPGPMAGGTFQPDNPAFRVYKLYLDSLEPNPSIDYLMWPTDQGAPLDVHGKPLFRGHQTLWTVFNDADPAHHNNDGGETDPLGIEVRLLAWAEDDDGPGVIPGPRELIVNQLGRTPAHATVTVIEGGALTGHDYMIVVDSSEIHGPVWHLIDETLGMPVVEDRHVDIPDTVDGVEIIVTLGHSGFGRFEVIANAGGSLDPPVPGAMASAGFPTPGGVDPGTDQQVGNGIWLFHTADNGGTSAGGTRADYDAFVSRVTLNGSNLEAIGLHDYEMRFTGSNSNPDANGSYTIEVFYDDNVFWVPFELWRIGIGTPDDPSDDVRLVPLIIDDYGENFEGNDQYGLESWGSGQDETGSGDLEHSVSDGDDDPFTDWVYWYEPRDLSPGEAGYLANEAGMLYGTYDYSLLGDEVMARTVLVNWDGGIEPPFTQDCPEQGTIFRISTNKEQPRDTFTFTAEAAPTITTGDEGTCIYLEYWIHNKGGSHLEDCYVAFWIDPDLGTAGDDFVGCDTLDNMFFCYNSDNDDGDYGEAPPALGFKYLVGPIVPWPGETTDFHGQPWSDHKDLGMTAFSRFIGALDPDNATETYASMQGIIRGVWPYVYNGDTLVYHLSGDPVTGVGDLDIAPADRRMLGSSGPFDLNPNDSLYVLLRMTVRHGDNNLDAITKLREVINRPFSFSNGIDGPTPGQLPTRFTVEQNYPNPFNATTTIRYNLPEPMHVKIDIYNILGQKVTHLVNQVQPAGYHRALWDGTAASGETVATGVYFYKVTAGDNIEKKKMVLLK